MIVPDVNMLIYAHNSAAPEHKDARPWWESLLNGAEIVGLPWIVSAGFVRVASNPKALESPLPREIAVDYLLDWFALGHVIPLNPGPDHLILFRRNAAVPGGGPNLSTDAHIAAIAMEYSAEVHSADRDFGRFPGVRWRNPLVQEPTA